MRFLAECIGVLALILLGIVLCIEGHPIIGGIILGIVLGGI